MADISKYMTIDIYDIAAILTIPVNAVGDTAWLAGGRINASNFTKSIEYYTISTTGNATAGGDISTLWGWMYGAANGVNDRFVFGGGRKSTPSSSYINDIEYSTMSLASGSVSFGDLTITVLAPAATSNGINDRIVWMGGVLTGGARTNTMGYATISTTGNATDFGDLTVGRNSGASGNSNTTNERGLLNGGYSGATTNIIDYITINSTGNATDFGDLTVARNHSAALSNGTNERGITGGGENGTTTIDYVTINSTGNATDFGDCTANFIDIGISNMENERGVFNSGIGYLDLMEYITIDTTGNTTDFGDLNTARDVATGASNT